MFYKNKVTGLIWEVVDSDHIMRCENDPDYVKVEGLEGKNKEKTKKETPKANKPKRRSTSKEGE
ncbi:hypothetical protein [Bacillus infantis]|uniref:hypothetical protein n=1 Tax=Bacillus infantis TaxID=324767 RepID=UPI003CFB795E